MVIHNAGDTAEHWGVPHDQEGARLVGVAAGNFLAVSSFFLQNYCGIGVIIEREPSPRPAAHRRSRLLDTEATE